MMGRVVIAIIALFLLLGAFAVPISNGIKTWRTDQLTHTEEDVVTDVNETSANVTLPAGRTLFQADASNATVTSSITESPVASSYDEDTRELLITGLVAEQTRTLTIRYLVETEDTVMKVIGPFLAVLIFGGLIGALFYGVYKGGGRG